MKQQQQEMEEEAEVVEEEEYEAKESKICIKKEDKKVKLFA